MTKSKKTKLVRLISVLLGVFICCMPLMAATKKYTSFATTQGNNKLLLKNAYVVTNTFDNEINKVDYIDIQTFSGNYVPNLTYAPRENGSNVMTYQALFNGFDIKFYRSTYDKTICTIYMKDCLYNEDYFQKLDSLKIYLYRTFFNNKDYAFDITCRFYGSYYILNNNINVDLNSPTEFEYYVNRIYENDIPYFAIPNEFFDILEPNQYIYFNNFAIEIRYLNNPDYLVGGVCNLRLNCDNIPFYAYYESLSHYQYMKERPTEVISNTITDFFNIEIFPNFYVHTILIVLAGAFILGFGLKVFLGG